MPTGKTGSSIRDAIPSSGKSTAAKKTAQTKTAAARRPASVPKTNAPRKKTTASGTAKASGRSVTAKKGTAGKNELILTAAEKKLIALYREADQAAKEKCLQVLKGQETDILSGLISGAGEMLGDLVGPALENILNPKR